jgi:hypothetical protein
LKSFSIPKDILEKLDQEKKGYDCGRISK